MLLIIHKHGVRNDEYDGRKIVLYDRDLRGIPYSCIKNPVLSLEVLIGIEIKQFKIYLSSENKYFFPTISYRAQDTQNCGKLTRLLERTGFSLHAESIGQSTHIQTNGTSTNY